MKRLVTDLLKKHAGGFHVSHLRCQCRSSCAPKNNNNDDVATSSSSSTLFRKKSADEYVTVCAVEISKWFWLMVDFSCVLSFLWRCGLLILCRSICRILMFSKFSGGLIGNRGKRFWKSTAGRGWRTIRLWWFIFTIRRLRWWNWGRRSCCWIVSLLKFSK